MPSLESMFLFTSWRAAFIDLPKVRPDKSVSCLFKDSHTPVSEPTVISMKEVNNLSYLFTEHCSGSISNLIIRGDQLSLSPSLRRDGKRGREGRGARERERDIGRATSKRLPTTYILAVATSIIMNYRACTSLKILNSLISINNAIRF